MVADAFRDLLTAALRGRPADPARSAHRRSGHLRDDPWDDDPDDWHRDDDDESDRYRDDPAERSRQSMTAGQDSPPPTSWASALSAGIMATKLLLARRLRLWACLGAGFAVGAAALAGGPAVRTTFAAVAAALELVCLTQPGPD